MSRPPLRTAAVCLGLGLLTAVGGTACARDPGAGSTPPSDAPVALTAQGRDILEQHLDERWQLVSGTVGDDELEIGDNFVTFGAYEVDDVLHLGGNACNGFGMPTSGEFAGEVSSTAMACEGGNLMPLESAVMHALPRIADVTVDGDALILSGDRVALTWNAITDPP